MPNYELENKHIIVSGAARGIGAAVMTALINEGAKPIGIDIEPFGMSELARRIASFSGIWRVGQEFEFFQGDAGDEQAMKQIFESFQTFTGLVNNAGLLGGDQAHGGRNLNSFDKMMAAHAKTALVLTELAHPKISAGSIVNVGSIELIMAAPNVVLYTAAKGALLGMTVAYATTLAPNIRVNMVSPGNVNTERNLAQYKDGTGRVILKRFEGRTPLQRSVEPIEVAHSILYLLSPLSSAITGQELVIDAGYTRALWDSGWTKK